MKFKYNSGLKSFEIQRKTEESPPMVIETAGLVRRNNPLSVLKTAPPLNPSQHPQFPTGNTVSKKGLILYSASLKMSLVSHCAKRFQTNKSNFTIDHILNVAGGKQNLKNVEHPHDTIGEDKKFEWLSCTRYRPPKLPRQGKKEGIQRRKLGRNPRIPFSTSQVAFLEAKFHRTPYLSSSDVTNLATQLKLSETRVKIWFQNRRARERREKETKPKSEENLSSKNYQKQNSIQQPTAILPFEFPKYFPIDYTDSFKFMAYAKSVNSLHLMAPMDLTDRQILRSAK